MIDRATADKIKDVANIVDVVGDYVQLVKRGANYMGLCPFHNERTPSFSVNPARNFCYCFSCHKGGSPVNFLMEKEGISYHDALLRLADRYGIEVKEKELTDEERQFQSRRESMFIANEWAMKQMQDWLANHEEGRNVGLQYFYGRGLTQEAIKAFRLGYSLDSGFALLNAAEKKGYDVSVLKDLGLIGTSQSGRNYDRFRGRVMFPILNTSGKVVAFGGRDLKGGMAKYINSPESMIYKKSNELYGLHQAKNAISRQDKCYLVEGYLDVIGMWQSGMENVVASSGTALTDGQIALIHRFTKNVTLIYDGDAAGIKAALRGIDMLLAHKLNVKVLLLPDGDDPDSFARKHTPEEFRKYVEENETDIIRFKTRILAQDATDPQSRMAAIRSVVETLAVIPDAIKRNVYIQECSKLLNISEQLIATETAKAHAKVMEDARKKREFASIQPLPETPTPAQKPPLPDSVPEKETLSSGFVSPLYPFEHEVIRYCVRYGMMEFCEGVDEGGNVVSMSLYEFVTDEIEIDNVEFSVPLFKKVFDLIGKLQATYDSAMEEYMAGVEEQVRKRRQEGIEAIANRADLDMRGIEKEESQLEERLGNLRQSLCMDFSKEYVGRHLASHEDDEVRNLVNDLITDKYQLSKYHVRTAKIETEDERLGELVPRAITEWKNGILKLKLNEVLKKMKEANEQGDLALVARLQQESAKIIQTRKKVAKSIGERIISPK